MQYASKKTVSGHALGGPFGQFTLWYQTSRNGISRRPI